jgi:hypothetical protein
MVFPYFKDICLSINNPIVDRETKRYLRWIIKYGMKFGNKIKLQDLLLSMI